MKDKCSNEDGSTLLIVVIIMSITFIMSGIVFSYSLRTYRMMDDSYELFQAKAVAETGIYDGIMSVVDYLDTGNSTEMFEVTNNSVFDADSDCSYNAFVYEEGFYDLNDYMLTGNVKHFLVKRIIPEIEGVPQEVDDVDTTYALEVIGKYKTSQITRKRIIHIISNEDDYYEIDIYTCYK